MSAKISLPFVAILSCNSAVADEARIEGAKYIQSGNSYTFSVTLRHGDTGWDDYADGWRIETVAGVVLGTRTLLHPHVNEQPFTRSLSGIEIPEYVATVFVRASTNTGGWGKKLFEVSLER